MSNFQLGLKKLDENFIKLLSGSAGETGGEGLVLQHPRALIFTLFCMKDTHHVISLNPLPYFVCSLCFDLRMDIYC